MHACVCARACACECVNGGGAVRHGILLGLLLLSGVGLLIFLDLDDRVDVPRQRACSGRSPSNAGCPAAGPVCRHSPSYNLQCARTRTAPRCGRRSRPSQVQSSAVRRSPVKCGASAVRCGLSRAVLRLVQASTVLRLCRLPCCQRRQRTRSMHGTPSIDAGPGVLRVRTAQVVDQLVVELARPVVQLEVLCAK